MSFAAMIVLVLALLLATGCEGTSPAPATRPAPAAGAVRFVTFNTFMSNRGDARVLAEIRAGSADVVFVQEIVAERADAAARALGMHYAFRRHVRHPVEGVAIYSRWPLANVEPVVDERGRTCALFADVLMPGRPFTVASVHLQAVRRPTPGNVIWSDRVRAEELALIERAWSDRGSPPIVVGGDFNQLARGANYRTMTRHLTDAMATLGKVAPTLRRGPFRLRVDYFLCSKEWKPLDGGVVATGASDHALLWIDLYPQ